MSIGIPRNHVESYHYYMIINFFAHVDINPSNAHVLDGNATDLQAECMRYEVLIKEAGGIHLFIGGKFLRVICESENISMSCGPIPWNLVRLGLRQNKLYLTRYRIY